METFWKSQSSKLLVHIPDKMYIFFFIKKAYTDVGNREMRNTLRALHFPRILKPFLDKILKKAYYQSKTTDMIIN